MRKKNFKNKSHMSIIKHKLKIIIKKWKIIIIIVKTWHRKKNLNVWSMIKIIRSSTIILLCQTTN